ncbi:MAG: 3-dehydroquinate synthase II [Spirochaetae bacterium HGW-Spirochaetae-1]|jgi:3-dehydroquinate synthase II|nr:MAG: 3-dehydroquinate synthase II [Spirochaetae bacterium HGW-Spirochaetae-1]
MKQCWLHLSEWKKDLVTESIENGVDAILTTAELAPRVRELGRITVVAPGVGDLKIPEDVEIIAIGNKSDENRVAQALKSRIVVVRTTDWEIIPIENLIPQGGDSLFAFVRNMDDVKLSTGIMEKGVAGIVLETMDAADIGSVVRYVRDLGSENFDLVELTVTGVKTIGIGDRVCVDTCSNLNTGEGLLVGNSSRGLFLVHAENVENPYVAPRPFRVNAGAVHSYVRVPGDRTRYLGELKTGDPVQIIGSSGKTNTVYVGRSKIEKRPMLVVYAADENGEEHSVVLQNAETIRLTSPGGEPLSVVELKPGDKVLGFIEGCARHFGMAVDETISEQ